MVIYFLVPNPIRKVIWDKWLKMGYAPLYEDKKDNSGKLYFVEHTLIPLTILSIMGVTTFGFFDVIRIYYNIPYKKRPSLLHFFFEKDLK